MDKWNHLAECTKAKKKHDQKHHRFQCPFTTSDAGQLKWGGWNDAGRAEWKAVVAKAKDARGRDHVEEMEEDCLKRLRVKHKVDQKKAKRGKKRARIHEDEESDGADEFGF